MEYNYNVERCIVFNGERYYEGELIRLTAETGWVNNTIYSVQDKEGYITLHNNTFAIRTKGLHPHCHEIGFPVKKIIKIERL